MKHLLILMFVFSIFNTAKAQFISSIIDNLWGDILVKNEKVEKEPFLLSSAPEVELNEKKEKKVIVKKVAKKVTIKKVAKVPRKAVNKVAAETKVDSVSVKDSAISSQSISGATTVVELDQEKKSQEKKFSTKLVLGTSTTFHKDTDVEREADFSVEAFLRYKLNSSYGLVLKLVGEKTLTGGREELSKDSRITLNHTPLKITESLSFAPSVAANLPTSKNSRKRDEMRTRIDINPAFTYQINDFVSFSYLPRLQKYFHKFETSKNNKVLTDYAVTQYFSMGFSLTEKLSISPTLIYSSGWNYRGTKKADAYFTITELGYAYSKSLSFQLGLLTSGKVIDNEKGKDETIEIFNKDKSSAYLSASLLF